MAEPTKRVLLGELLVQSKVITPEQLGEILSSPREHGKKLGQMLLERGWVTEAQLTQTLSLQLSVPWVSLYHIDFSRQLLSRVSREIAEQYCLIPIFVRHVKGQGETLYVAMDDPTNEGALAEVSRVAGLPCRPMIASATDIRSAIRLYYGEPAPAPSPALDMPMPTLREPRGKVEAPATPVSAPETPRMPSKPPPVPVARRAAKPSVPPPPPAPATPRPEDSPPPTVRLNQPPEPPESEPKLEPSAELPVPVPAAVRPRRPRTLSLTLLDGTTISLPAAGKGEKTAPAEALTAQDVVSALRAAAHGANAREVLGDRASWEAIVAALLTVLLRKGLIADWEFVEELRKL